MRYINLAFLFLMFTGFTADAQSVGSPLYTSLTNQSPGAIKEKMYVHTDKTFYVAGEIVWFKLYCVDAASGKPTDLSKIAYIEVIDSANKPLAQAKIELHNATGDGSFQLPFSTSSGNYKLRAYTNWMKNAGADDFFEKNITIINVQKITVDNSQKNEAKNNIQFFPEGGYLLQNIKSLIAFKAASQNGKGIAFTGALLDNNDTVLHFNPDPNGIGSFYVTPLKNHTYQAVVQPEKGSVFTQQLPNIKEDGFLLHADISNNSNVVITIETSGEPSQPVYLIIHKNKQALLAKETALQNGKATFNINTNTLPAGVSTFTVFNAAKEPVCERLYYKKSPRSFQLSLTANQSFYNRKQKVNIAIGSNNYAAKNNDSASISLAVYRIDSLQTVDDNTIDAYLYLTADLKGEVENAAYYLTEKNDSNQAINNLLLVNGWRTFSEAKTTERKEPLFSFAPEYNGHIITGKIINTTTGLPQKNVLAYLSLPGKSTQFYTGISDSTGTAKWETKNWYGSSKLIVQTNETEDSNCTIRMEEPFSQHFSATAFRPFTLPYFSSNTLLQHSIAMQVQNIYSENEIAKFTVLPTDSTPFYLSPDKTYKLDDYTRFATLEEVLREYVALVNVEKRKGEYHFPVYDFSSAKMLTDDPLVLVDGVPFFNLNHFIAIDPLKLKTLDVVNRRYMYGNAVFDGILNWQTYTGNATDIDIDPRAVTIDYEGLQEKREFYSPAYETEEQQNSHVPDFRNTLYWNANITLPPNTEKPLSFYTSDLPGKYAVVVQGMTANGLCSSEIITIEVREK